jgi:hypothetical protein
MSNFKVYNNNCELKKNINYPNINITTSPLSKNVTSFVKIDKDSTIQSNRKFTYKIKPKITINKTSMPSKSPISTTKRIINTESTLSKTDEDDQDIERFKFLLNKLLKNPRSKSIIINEIKSALENNSDNINADSNNINSQKFIEEGLVVKLKTLSFNASMLKEIDHHRNTSTSFKYNKVRLIKHNPYPRKQSENQINIKVKSTNSRNDVLLKSQTLLKSIEIPTLDLQTLNSKNDFNYEFVSKADDFSPSWRNDCIKAQLIN